MTGTETTVDGVVTVIRERIRRGDLSPGQRLIEADLTRDLGVSRGPLREALGRLSAEGLVTIERNRGAMVRTMTRQDIENIYQVREVVEGLAARLVAQRIAEKAVRKRVQTAVDRMAAFAAGGDAKAYLEENDRFHELVLELAGNPIVGSMLGTFRTQIYRYAMRDLLDERSRVRSCGQHVAVGKAILNGDATRAERLMRNHVKSSGEAVLALVAAGI